LRLPCIRATLAVVVKRKLLKKSVVWLKPLESLNLCCSFQEREWFFNGNHLHDKVAILSEFSPNDTLRISSVEISDAGNYECRIPASRNYTFYSDVTKVVIEGKVQSFT